MANKTNPTHCICGGILKPGQRACCRFCLQSIKNDEALAKHKTKSEKKSKKKKSKTLMSFLCLMIIILSGCQVPEQRKGYDPDPIIDILKDLQTTNATSSPVNPYALPIGAGLAGVIAMLESLRRVEKGKRKYAEHELSNNNKNHS